MEGPWSKVLNPPLLEWSCSGLNNKLRVSTHVTLPLPPLHHAAAVRWSLWETGLTHRNTLYYWKGNTDICSWFKKKKHWKMCWWFDDGTGETWLGRTEYLLKSPKLYMYVELSKITKHTLEKGDLSRLFTPHPLYLCVYQGCDPSSKPEGSQDRNERGKYHCSVHRYYLFWKPFSKSLLYLHVKYRLASDQSVNK